MLLDEVVRLLSPRPGEAVLDCTAGRGGHASAMASLIGPTGTLVLADMDPANLVYAAARVRALPSPPRVIELQGNFAEAPHRLGALGVAVNVLLADLGFSTNQVFDGEKGLSFTVDAPLDMRLDPSGPLTAAELVNTASERELERIIREFGEERAARRIAEKLVAERARAPISTTGRLASVVREVQGVSTNRGKIDSATRTFQALRIAVNDEMGNLAALLAGIERAARDGAAGRPAWLLPGARVGFISFHSLEDRQVKRSFAALHDAGLARELTRKPVEPGEDEVRRNRRARSARFRAAALVGESPARG